MQNNKTRTGLKTLDKLTRLLPFLFWVFLIFGFDEPYIAILTVISAFVHEAAHLGVAALLGGFSLRARLHGFGMMARKHLSYREDMIVTAAGPLANLLMFLLLLPLGKKSEYLAVFAFINLFTAASNLLPVIGYDGYRLISLLSEHRLRFGALRAANAVSTVILSLLSLLSLYAVSRLNTGYFASVTLIFLLVKSLGEGKTGFHEKKRAFARF